MALVHNQQAVQAIIAELEPLILGQERPAWSCGCGALHHGASVAVRIVPAGDTYPGQETEWYIWTVEMRDPQTTPEGGYSYSTGLSEFLPVPQLEEIFYKHFQGRHDG